MNLPRKAKSHVQQIITELKVARDLSLIKGERQGEAARRAAVSKRSEVLGNQRAAWNLIAHFVTEKGFETNNFDPILARNQIALQRIADERKTAAIEQSSSVLKTFFQGIDGRRKALDTLISSAQPPKYVMLDSPFLIWPTNGIELWDSKIVPYASFAKITLDSSKTFGHEELGFYFLWENPSDRYAVINVDTALGLFGVIHAKQDGGFWPGDRYANLSVDGNLHTFEWWNQPPTEPLFQADQSQHAGGVTATGGGFSDVGDYNLVSISQSIDLQHTLFVLPPNGVTVIEVTAVLQYVNGADSGHVTADFNSAISQILCPFVLLTVLT